MNNNSKVNYESLSLEISEKILKEYNEGKTLSEIMTSTNIFKPEIIKVIMENKKNL